MLCLLLFASALLPYILILSLHFCCYVLVFDLKCNPEEPRQRNRCINYAVGWVIYYSIPGWWGEKIFRCFIAPNVKGMSLTSAYFSGCVFMILCDVGRNIL